MLLLLNQEPSLFFSQLWPSEKTAQQTCPFKQPFSVSKATNTKHKQRSWIANALLTSFIAKSITSFTSSWACGSFSFFDASSTLTRASRFLVRVCWACCHVLYTRRRSWKQAYGKKKLVFRHEKITQKKISTLEQTNALKNSNSP